MTTNYANPSSLHAAGKRAKQSIRSSRSAIAENVGARPSEIIFTSGGTESDNLAVRGSARSSQEGQHVVISAIEHKAVLKAASELEKMGFEVARVKADEEGRIRPEAVEKALREDTALVSIMLVNNEVGTIQPVEEIAKKAHEVGALMHTDAVQALGKTDVDVEDLDVDLLSLSGHKIHGPKGIGALFVRQGTKLSPLQVGGGQENGIRAGTENVPGAVGFAKAIEVMKEDFESKLRHIRSLRDWMKREISAGLRGVVFNGTETKQVPHILSVSVEDIEINYVLQRLSSLGVYVTSGSACASGSLEPSHVLREMGLPHDLAQNTIRFSLSAETTEGEVKYAVSCLKEVVRELRGNTSTEPSPSAA